MGRAVGLRGEVEVAVASDHPERFAAGSIVLTAGELEPLTVGSVRTHGDRTIVSFAEITDRTRAESLTGAELVVSADAARPLDTGEYWDHDLIGCSVVTSSGDEVGRVTDVLHAPANEVLVVQGQKGEHLIPLIRDVVLSVDPRVLITIEPIPGLLD